MKHVIGVVTGTRAEYGLLRGLVFKLKERPELDVRLLVTGSHLSEAYGHTMNEISADGFSDAVQIPIPTDDDSKSGMGIAAGCAMKAFSEYFRNSGIELLIALGDRFEVFGVVGAAHLCGIPVAHLCGGDVTEGAVDDALRHSITKLSYLHFPASEESAKRIVQMGEEPSRVFNVGALSVDNCVNTRTLSTEELARDLGFNGFNGDYAVVTFHPVTLENDTAADQLKELISAMDSVPGMNYVITLSNTDAGGRKINEIWRSETESRPNWFVTPSLGVVRYISAVKGARFVLGNSSSGVVEVPALGIPTVNIGDRQEGRFMASSVVCCKPRKADILEAIESVLSLGFSERIRPMENPFGDGHAADKIVGIIVNYLNNHSADLKKKFYDIQHR